MSATTSITASASSRVSCGICTDMTGESPLSRNPGLLWLDDESAKRLIDAKVHAGEITPQEAENLRKFAVAGDFVTSVTVTADDAAAIDRDVDRLWREKP